MKTVIFAGGLGSRISEESHLKPKPMIEIGGKPILWHIMKIYSHYGYNEFIICLGYKGHIIKEYFSNFFLHNCDITFDLASNEMTVHENNVESFKVTLVDTGFETMTGGRLQRVHKYLKDDKHFMLTYGDGVTDVNISDLVDFHLKHKKTCTVTAIQPAGKFGVLEMDNNDHVSGFIEKPKKGGAWINGGFFVLSEKVWDFMIGDMTDVMWEQDPMKSIQKAKEMVAFKHHGFWKSMDILRDKVELENLWKTEAPWKIWN
jgi:glucose-1-phosphate cytidylyltransferase